MPNLQILKPNAVLPYHNIASQTPNPKPQTPNPKTQPPNPEPHTLHTQDPQTPSFEP